MPQRVYRVCRSRWSDLDGEGARRAGSRWNSPGRAIVYMAQSLSLAVLENLVHLSRQDFPKGYVSIAATIPDDLLILHSAETQDPLEAGNRWFDERASAVLRVPSMVVPAEYNFLLNPQHPHFDRITAAPPEPFHFDPRLFP